MATDSTENVTRLPRQQDDLDYDFTEDQLARNFCRLHPNFRWVEQWRRWLRFDGKVWAVDKTLHFLSMIRDFLRDRSFSSDKPERLRRAQIAKSVENLARSDRSYAMTADQWDQDDFLLNTPDGVIDLKTGQLKKHDPTFYMTKITTVGPGSDCDLWLHFLRDVTCGDSDLIDYLQRVVGYLLTGSTVEHVFFFLYGSGGNGKTTFLNTIGGLLGNYAAVAAMEVFTQGRGERHPTELAMLRGARVVIATETEEGRRWAESRIKQLTGGDPVSARFMRQDFFTYTPKFKLIVAGNHKPSLACVDEAMRRRLHLIPFTERIPIATIDKDLPDKLREEWPGILRWAVLGFQKYQKCGLAPPKSVIDATNTYFDNQDLFAQWLESCCEQGENCWGASSELFSSWKEFCYAANQQSGPIQRFNDRLASARFINARTNARGRHWRGVQVARIGMS